MSEQRQERVRNQGRRNVVALGLTSFFNDSATELAYWILPAFIAGPLHAGPAALGWIEGLAEGTASISRLLSGWWTDRVGRRKPFVLFGYLLANVVKPLLAFVVSPLQVLAIRVGDRFAKGIRGAPRDAMLAESTGAATRGAAFGFRQAMDSAGAIVGPLAAFLLLSRHFDIRTIFLLAAIPGTIAVLLVLLAVRETGHAGVTPVSQAPPNQPAARQPSPLQVRGYLHLLIAVSVFAIGNSSDLFLVLRAQQFMSTSWAPMLGLVFNASYTALAWPAGRLSDYVPRKWLLASGYFVFAGVYAGFAMLGAAWQAWLLFVLYGLYYGLSEGVLKAMIADLVPRETRGHAYGIQATLYGILVLLASLITGYLWKQFGAAIPFSVSAACALVAACLVLSLPSSKIRS
jgi:MFS family permease